MRRRIPRSKSNEDEKVYSTLVSRLITQLGRLDGDDREGKDLCKSGSVGKVRGAAALVSFDVLPDEYQISFTLGAKRWRLRRSIRASLITIKMSKERFNITRSCARFQTTNEYEHFDAVVNNVENAMRIRSFTNRNVMSSNSMLNENN